MRRFGIVNVQVNAVIVGDTADQVSNGRDNWELVRPYDTHDGVALARIGDGGTENAAQSDEISNRRNTCAPRDCVTWSLTASLRHTGAGARRLVRGQKGAGNQSPGARAAMPEGTPAGHNGKAHD